MCYFFYKNGKNKQSSSSTQGQSENQYGRQPAGDLSAYPEIHKSSRTNPVTVNPSYGKHRAVTASFDEDPPQTMYEAVNVR